MSVHQTSNHSSGWVSAAIQSGSGEQLCATWTGVTAHCVLRQLRKDILFF